MVFEPKNPLDSFFGLFDNNDVDSRALLDKLVPQTQINYLGDIPIDVLEEFSYNEDFEISDRPVQSGYPVTQSRRGLPPIISIIGVQVTGQNQEDVQENIEGISILEGPSWKDKLDEIEELVSRQELITLTTSHKVYSDYLIQNFNFRRVAGEQGDALFFGITLKLSTFTQAQVSQVSPEMIPQKIRKKKNDRHKKGDDQNSDKKDKGNRTPEDNRTLAKQIYDGFPSIFD